MIDPQSLLNFGMAGVFIAYLIQDRNEFQKGLKTLIENNTTALIRVHDVIEKCRKK